MAGAAKDVGADGRWISDNRDEVTLLKRRAK
jgi:hypothetical protein